MSGAFMTAAAATSTVCAGVAGGVYFAFSVLVMPALRTLSSDQGVLVMRRINTHAVKFPFMVVFFGGAAASAALVIAEIFASTATEGTANRMAGAGLSLAAFGITIVRNVPLNNKLARIAPGVEGTAAPWAAFDRGWSRANHVRTAASIAATVVLLASPATTLW